MDLIAEKICEQAKLGGVEKLERLCSGGNNQVFKLTTSTGAFLLKRYFHSPNDKRDRLLNEFSFSRYVWDAGARSIPEPIHADFDAKVGVFEFIDGKKPKKATSDYVAEAINFLVAINRSRHECGHDKLPMASEAALSVNEHIAIVEDRIARLENVDGEAELTEFLQSELKPFWRDARKRAVSFDLPLRERDICVSPSDFGFHNALVRPDGKIIFLDFEYAGLDDPAKMICDFFSQPAVPVPAKHQIPMIEALEPLFSEDLRLKHRVAALDMLFKTKWICIILNEFLRSGGKRRLFADDSGPPLARRQAIQLRKAKEYLTTCSQSRD